MQIKFFISNVPFLFSNALYLPRKWSYQVVGQMQTYYKVLLKYFPFFFLIKFHSLNSLKQNNNKKTQTKLTKQEKGKQVWLQK